MEGGSVVMAKNFEVFKTADERFEGFRKFCKNRDCEHCPCEGKVHGTIQKCTLVWLDLEYEEKPKPCPFCGHTEVDIVLSGCHGGFDACCKDCGATVIAESKTMVIEKWNRRTT
jgi:Lar family restriction alleviation protein